VPNRSIVRIQAAAEAAGAAALGRAGEESEADRLLANKPAHVANKR
jgi:hypothetical protein